MNFVLNIECPLGFYGDNCQEYCSFNCMVPLDCDRVTGRCTHGCQSGWEGDRCVTRMKNLIILFFIKRCVHKKLPLIWLLYKKNIYKKHSYVDIQGII